MARDLNYVWKSKLLSQFILEMGRAPDKAESHRHMASFTKRQLDHVKKKKKKRRKATTMKPQAFLTSRFLFAASLPATAVVDPSTAALPQVATNKSSTYVASSRAKYVREGT